MVSEGQKSNSCPHFNRSQLLSIRKANFRFKAVAEVNEPGKPYYSPHKGRACLKEEKQTELKLKLMPRLQIRPADRTDRMRRNVHMIIWCKSCNKAVVTYESKVEMVPRILHSKLLQSSPISQSPDFLGWFLWGNFFDQVNTDIQQSKQFFKRVADLTATNSVMRYTLKAGHKGLITRVTSQVENQWDMSHTG